MFGEKWTLADLRVGISGALDDSANARWSATEVDDAIREAIRLGRQKWGDERVDDTQTYDDDDFRYDLPKGCEKVLFVYFAPISDTDPRHEVSPATWHQEGTELVFTRSYATYDQQTMYIHYLTFPANLLSISLADGAVATAVTTALTSAAATFTTAPKVREGDEVIIYKAAYAGNGTYYVVSIDSATQLTLNKAPGAIGATLTYYVAHYTDMPYTYLKFQAMAELYQLDARNRPGRNVEERLRWAAWYDAKADRAMRDMLRKRRALRRY